MNIHEYQAKKLLKKYKINIPKGAVAYTPLEAEKVAKKISNKGPWVLKSQIQSGARAKGHFLNKGTTRISGVEFIKKETDIYKIADQMLSNRLVTPQTTSQGKLVSKIYVEAFEKTKRCFYISFVINRIEACITLLVANETDDIVDLAQQNPQSILRINLGLKQKISKHEVEHILNFLDLKTTDLEKLTEFIEKLHHAFLSLDATMLEINPVALNNKGAFVALDAKISFDDNALFRHPEVQFMNDDYEIGDAALKASKCGFKYREFGDGNIGLIVNGDGLAFAIRDYLKQMNEQTACYLNIKGGVDDEKIAEGLKIILTNPKVEGIMVNILGGFLRCNLVADGIISAVSEIGLNLPIVVRFEGTNKDSAKDILQSNHFDFLTADSLQEATVKLIKAMRESE